MARRNRARTLSGEMIIRQIESTLQLITQPDHAALAVRIVRALDTVHFPESSRKASILRAVEHHDDGWMEADETLIVTRRPGGSSTSYMCRTRSNVRRRREASTPGEVSMPLHSWLSIGCTFTDGTQMTRSGSRSSRR